MSSPTSQCVLSQQQKTKIQKLLGGNTSDQILLAVILIETSGATADDALDLFSTPIISIIVNTWDTEVWNAVAPLLQEHETLCQSFRDFVEKRLLTKNQDFRKRFLRNLFRHAASPVTSLMKDCWFLCKLDSWVLSELPTLPDAAFEPLAKYSVAMRRRVAGWYLDYLAKVLGIPVL
ncbi:hypothetical protein [Allorhodopirellula heiligendammensis]|uniref:Uncharacterized protein n=1 Tax=Allorhodopirellula heiligendammensis TaxID=2714739 RepID=A0A5C6BFU7_9BACT|nr:hypothetical protein [Allorhodopirellula heiligendammensis]TWU10517.1 hypothetical protein Poly21_44220 [Allorhodopirellula heiligendammensis]